MTDNVCLRRRPVFRIDDRPRLLLLSFLHLIGDVENLAMGALRVHWTEGTRKASTATGVRAAMIGRSVRLCIEVIVSLDCASGELQGESYAPAAAES
jgi:hypothetical protein